ncbi:MAG: hypothetical protein M0Q24_04820 [Sulfurimonas sp.]|uniref:hypothetical protein n=1 Tax=Sulfurimonas sp. TaxID=2022749 RepID=UPI0025EAE093|nr:hypothetical protein [Sulfurimonas sp.]MCK9491392.1 hypothetical protein [Sulfurimonas sp.]
MLDIEKIEKKYNLSNLKYKNFFIWAYLRGVYGSVSLYKNREYIITKAEKFNIYKNILNFKNLFYGFKNWFSKYNYIFFGDTDSLKIINEKYGDRMGHEMIQLLGEKNFLYIESLNKEKFYSIKDSYYKKVSENFIFIFIKIIQIFLILTQKKYKKNILDEINKEFVLDINYNKFLKKFEAEYFVYSWLFKIYKPKLIVITCFTRRTIIKSANDLNITTIEFQHGVIKSNYAYEVLNKLDRNFSPLYLLVYGDNDKSYLEPYDYSNNIISIGNYYLNYIKSKNIIIKEFDMFNLKIVVSLQSPVAENMNLLINNISLKFPNILFIVVPRREIDKKNLNLSKNVKIISKYNYYEIANECDLHISSYSTCLIEAPFFGLSNIFINFNGLSDYYYKDYINDKSYNYKVDTEKELITLLENIKPKEKCLVMKEHNGFFAADKHIGDFVKRLSFEGVI